MKRKLAVLCCIVLTLVMVTAIAFAEGWFCPNCGTQNNGNFCTNCGEKRPTGKVQPSGNDISNIKFSYENNGDVILSWDDASNSPPYSVHYKASYDSGYFDEIKSKRFVLEYLIPGESYEVTVSNNQSESTASYTMPIKVFTDFSTGKKIELNETIFSISKVNGDKTKQYEFQVHYPQLRSNRSYKAKLVTKTPLGYGGYTWVWSTYEIHSRYAYIYTNFSMYEFFEGIKSEFEEIPTGQYTLEFYFDGQLYDDFTFNVVR